MREVYRQLRGISSDKVIGLGPNKVLSVPDAVGIAIERWMLEKQGIQQELLPGSAASAGAPVVEIAPVVAGARAVGVEGGGGEQIMFGGMQETLSGACPDCGSQLEYAEGCVKCHVCGYSECG
jgi:ribonucleoside-diphosphate reductase alpha chain